MTEGVKLVVRGRLANQDEWRNMFYYTGAGDFTTSTIQNWVTEIYTPLLTYMVDGTSIYGVDVATRLAGHVDTDVLGWGASEFIAVNIIGAGGSAKMPPADCALVLLRTGVKHVMGKKFIAGAAETRQDLGIIDASYKTALQSFGSKVLAPTADPLGSGSTCSVWGPVHGFTPVISVSVSDKMFHLARRQQGHGI